MEEETEIEVAVMGNLRIETAGTEEEVAEGLEAALGMYMEVVGEINREGKEEGEDTQRSLGAL